MVAVAVVVEPHRRSSARWCCKERWPDGPAFVDYLEVGLQLRENHEFDSSSVLLFYSAGASYPCNDRSLPQPLQQAPLEQKLETKLNLELELELEPAA